MGRSWLFFSTGGKTENEKQENKERIKEKTKTKRKIKSKRKKHKEEKERKPDNRAIASLNPGKKGIYVDFIANNVLIDPPPLDPSNNLKSEKVKTRNGGKNVKRKKK